VEIYQWQKKDETPAMMENDRKQAKHKTYQKQIDWKRNVHTCCDKKHQSDCSSHLLSFNKNRLSGVRGGLLFGVDTGSQHNNSDPPETCEWGGNRNAVGGNGRRRWRADAGRLTSVGHSEGTTGEKEKKHKIGCRKISGGKIVWIQQK